MHRGILGAVALALLGLGALSDATQPPGGERDKGPRGDKKGPPRFEVGKVLPPFVRDALELSPQQEEQVEALEKEVKKKLEKILTPDQLRQIRELKGPPRKGFDRDNFDEKGGKKKGKKKGDRPRGGDRPRDGDPKDDFEQTRGVPATIQWYATLASGRREAERTGRPMLLVSAAPHCAGVCGIW